jgi:hypothetical protein
MPFSSQWSRTSSERNAGRVLQGTPALSVMSSNAREATSRRYTRLGNSVSLVAELPAEHADFRKIKGSDLAPAGEQH